MKISHIFPKAAALYFIILCGIFCCALTAAQAAPWGLLKELDTTVSDQESPHNGEDIYKFYAMYKYLTNKPISYAVQADYGKDKDPDKLTRQIHTAFFSQAIENNFKTWIDQTRNYIYEQHREKDFKDILNILSKKNLKLRRVEKGNHDILFDFSTHTGAALYTYNTDMRIRVPNPFYSDDPKYKDRTNQMLIHEIGHYWGLADRYEEGVLSSSVEHSTSGDVNSDAIMSVSGGIKTKLTCDDVDGFINLIDYNLAKINGKYSKRADKGWKGLCDNNYYKQARQLNRPDHYRGFTIYSFNKDGTVAAEKSASLPSRFFTPFSMDEALTMDLNGIHKAVHPTDNYYVLFDFGKLAEKHYFEARLGVADRTIFIFSVQRQGKVWNINTKEPGKDFNQNTSVEISEGDCRYTADSYGDSIKNYTAVFNEQGQKSEHEYIYHEDKANPFRVISSTYGNKQFYRIYNQNYEVELTPSQFESYLNEEDEKYDFVFHMNIIEHLEFIQRQQTENVKACRFFRRLKKEGF